MSALEELKDCLAPLGIPIETGVFKSPPPEEYIIFTPLADEFELHADDCPGYDVQEVRISVFSRRNYSALKNKIIRAVLAADFFITDRRYIGHENDTGYHHYAVDTAKIYKYESEE